MGSNTDLCQERNLLKDAINQSVSAYYIKRIWSECGVEMPVMVSRCAKLWISIKALSVDDYK